MTFEEAKKILEKEGFYLIKFGGPSDIVNDPVSEDESPEIFEAGKVVNSAGYGVGMYGKIFNERKARLKKEYEKNTKAPGPGEEQPKEGNPALEEAASQFNDALLDEQAKKIAEKDEVIADLGNELAATKKELEEKTKLVEVVRKGSKEYCEYGIAAEKMIRKMAKVIVSDKPVSLKDFKEYRRLANGYSFNPQLFDFSEEEEKKLSLIRDDSVGAVTNQKNSSPFKDTHPTEDSPEEVELDEILELFVRL